MDIIIFALISGFLIYKLYKILGTNEDNFIHNIKPGTVKDVTPSEKIINNMPFEDLEIFDYPDQAAIIKKYDSNWSEKNFLKGVSKAFEMILEGYSKNDRKILDYLLDQKIYKKFTDELDVNIANSTSIEKILVSLNSVKISEINIVSNIANIKVTLNSEQIILKKDSNNNILEGNPSKTLKLEDNLVFARDLTSSNLNWKLTEI